MAGYSSTPLIRKLGIKPKAPLLLVDSPANFAETLGSLPDDVNIVATAGDPVDFVLVFVEASLSLRQQFAGLAARLVPDGMLWVAWPKKAAKTSTDLTEIVVRQIGLDAGLVDVKVCAIDEKWSGLKFVIRVQDR